MWPGTHKTWQSSLYHSSPVKPTKDNRVNKKNIVLLLKFLIIAVEKLDLLFLSRYDKVQIQKTPFVLIRQN